MKKMKVMRKRRRKQNKKKKEKKKETEQKGARKEKKKQEAKKQSVSKKRKLPQQSTGKRTLRRRVAQKKPERVPIHIVDEDTNSVTKEDTAEEPVPGNSSKGQGMGESSANLASMLQIILKTVKALEDKQGAFMNDTKASIAELRSQIDGLKTTVVETRDAILDKVDSITVEEVPADSSA